MRALREQIEQTKVEIEKAERAYDLNRAAELKYGKLAELEKRLQAESDQFTKKQAQSPLIKEEVGEEDIAEVVSRWTGVPVTKLLEGEMQKLLHLEDELHQRVIGQDEAVHGGGGGGDSRALGLEGSQPADRQLHFPGSHGRGQDRAGAGAGAVSVRRRTRHDPHRHVGVSGEAHGGAADRRASRIRGL